MPVTVPRTDPTLPVATRRRASLSWARLLARIYENRRLSCPRCQGPMRLIAFLTEPRSIRAILAHLGEPTTPPPLAPEPVAIRGHTWHRRRRKGSAFRRRGDLERSSTIHAGDRVGPGRPIPLLGSGSRQEGDTRADECSARRNPPSRFRIFQHRLAARGEYRRAGVGSRLWEHPGRVLLGCHVTDQLANFVGPGSVCGVAAAT